MNSNFESYILQLSGAQFLKRIEIIQELWSGYGSIVRYALNGDENNTIIVKHISLKEKKEHPRGWNTNFGHLRKVKSYEIEMNWYKNWSSNCNDWCKVPEFIGAFSESKNGDQWIVLEDLNCEFPLRKSVLNRNEIEVCLKWLAHFHAKFLGQKPEGLWEVGTYWNLETRPEEFEKIIQQELKEKANLIDTHLNSCRYQTIVHGDAKLANFCFSKDGRKVAGVDFQYVGGGCGMKDLAYFLGSCLDESQLEMLSEDLIDSYFDYLKNALTDSEINFADLEKEWREMYPLAWTDFTRFLLGWMPNHQKVNAYSLKMMDEVLNKLK